MNFHKIVLLLLIILQSLSASSQTMWCPKSGIGGFEAEAHQAKSILSSNTSDLQNMEAFITVKENTLYIHSNYKPEGAEYPFKLSTNEEVYNMKGLLKYLVNPEEVQAYNPTFNSAYKNNIVLKVDASVFSHPRYKNLAWENVENIKIVNGTQIFETEILPYTKNRAAKVHDHVYVELDIEKACEIADQLSKVKEIADKFYEANNAELKQDEISTTSTDEQLQYAVKQNTFGDFFNSVVSSGLTLVSFGCEPLESTKDLLLDAYRENVSGHQENVGQIKIHYPAETESTQVIAENSENNTPTVDNSTSTSEPSSHSGTGLGKAWYFIIGVVVLIIIKAIAKSAD